MPKTSRSSVGCIVPNTSFLKCFTANPSIPVSDDETTNDYETAQHPFTESHHHSRSRQYHGIGKIHHDRHRDRNPSPTSIVSATRRRSQSHKRENSHGEGASDWNGHRPRQHPASYHQHPSPAESSKTKLTRSAPSTTTNPYTHPPSRDNSREESVLYGGGDLSDSDDGDEGKTPLTQLKPPKPLVEPSEMKRGQEYFPRAELGEDLEFVRYVGHGSYGFVAEGFSRSRNQRVAIKKVLRIFNSVVDAKRLLRELRILRTLKKHESIVELISIVPPPNLNDFTSLILVFQYVDTDFAQLLQTPQYFRSLHVQHLMYQLLCGVKYMHSAQIVHRDLKPANILINEDCTLKICDFGLARGTIVNSRRPKAFVANGLHNTTDSQKKILHRELTNHVVTRWYRAPEVMLRSQNREYLPAVDMWSVGCIFAEMLLMQKGNCQGSTRRPLFPGRSSFPLSCKDPFGYADRRDQLNVIFEVLGTPTLEEIESVQDEEMKSYLRQLPRQHKKEFRTLFPKASEDALDLLQKLLQFDVKKRLSAEQALNHPYLAEIRAPHLEEDHRNERFEFEDVPLSIKELRELIVDEILLHNEELQIQFQNEREGRTSSSSMTPPRSRNPRVRPYRVASEPEIERPVQKSRHIVFAASEETVSKTHHHHHHHHRHHHYHHLRDDQERSSSPPTNIIHHREPSERSSRSVAKKVNSSPQASRYRENGRSQQKPMSARVRPRTEIIRHESPRRTDLPKKMSKRLSISRSKSPNPVGTVPTQQQRSSTPPFDSDRHHGHIQKSLQTALRING